MKVFIVGINGNMGQRYKHILKWLGHEVDGIDKESISTLDILKDKERVIIATPTATHIGYIDHIAHSNPEARILCEKPFINDEKHFGFLCESVNRWKKSNINISMVSQYDYLVDPESEGVTYYNYFKTGNDGLNFDCINIIWHAKGNIVLSNSSPIWDCIINGKRINLSDMDEAYIKMVQMWIHMPYGPIFPHAEYDRIIESHKKAINIKAYYGNFKQGFDRDSSSKLQHQTT